ncbi:MAG: excinuclease ABC subunit UvrC, partial [Bacillota bacterium]
FPVRACKSANLKRIKRECLNYHIGRCHAPCQGRITPDEYKIVIDKVIRFLSGNDDEVQNSLNKKMLESAKRQEFEMAMHYKEQLQILDKLVRKQTMPFKLGVDLDIFSFVTNGMLAVVNISAVRGGKLIGSQSASLNDTSKNSLSSYIMQYYEKNPILCSEIVVSEALDFQAELNDYLSHKAGKNINVIHPIGGIRGQLVDISLTNAKEYLQNQEQMILRKEDLTWGAVKQLYELLKLKKIPRRMECYDISNTGGTNKVASMVVFIDGEKANNHYRHFKIKSVTGANDFASMQEALERRLKRLKNNDRDISFSQKPDLIVVDGGKGQLSSALLAAKSQGADLEIISLAKKEEEVFVNGQKDSVILDKDSLALRLLIRIRDEAHRFAITHHRKLRQKMQTMSQLKRIEGIGEQKAKALLMHFKSVDKIKRASLDELQKVQGINLNLAKGIKEYLNENNKDEQLLIKG